VSAPHGLNMVSFSWPNNANGMPDGRPGPDAGPELTAPEAEKILRGLAGVFNQYNPAPARHVVYPPEPPALGWSEDALLPNLEARYRALVEQIPAVVFMAYLDRGIGEAYVSPQIEAALGFSQEEWLEDPVRWYSHIHPEDKRRWSTEAAEMFLTGNPLRSAYRVVARDGRVIWFHCEAKMIRKESGEPWFIHGVGFDITDLKQTEEALQEERNVVSAILDTVGALVVVLDPEGRIIRFNRAVEQSTGYSSAEVAGRRIWDLFMVPEEVEGFKAVFERLSRELLPSDYEGYLVRRDGERRLIAWSSTLLPGHDGNPASVAFMTKVQEQKLMEKGLPEADDAAKIVNLVNEAIHKTRELARGLLPVVSDAHGLMSALQQWAGEVEDLFSVSCHFQCFTPVLIHDDTVATHLYYIAREAVNNAIKHGHARHIVIRLAAVERQGALTIQDDGFGIGNTTPGNKGMGLHLMHYRARMAGGLLEIQRAVVGGTMVTCLFPVVPPGGAQ
jgi:PAS domain S-box-containing protein